MSATAFMKDVSADNKYALKLITSVNDNNEFFYAYLLLNAEHVPYLEAGLRTRKVELEEYGVILASGAGLEPDSETRERIEQGFCVQ